MLPWCPWHCRSGVAAGLDQGGRAGADIDVAGGCDVGVVVSVMFDLVEGPHMVEGEVDKIADGEVVEHAAQVIQRVIGHVT